MRASHILGVVVVVIVNVNEKKLTKVEMINKGEEEKV